MAESSGRDANASAGESKSTVIVAVDGSENSFHAFDWYMKYMYKPGVSIIIAHCPDYRHMIKTPVSSTDPHMIARLVEQCETDIANILQQIKAKLTNWPEVDARLVRLTGDAGPAIIKAAEEENASYIVTGSRGLGTLRRTLLGSVSGYVLHHAHCPVLVCQEPKEDS